MKEVSDVGKQNVSAVEIIKCLNLVLLLSQMTEIIEALRESVGLVIVMYRRMIQKQTKYCSNK